MIFDEIIVNNKQLFIDKVNKIAAFMSIPKPDILAIMFYLESGINAQAVNWQPGDPGSSNPAHDTDAARRSRCPYRATGIFQCMPSTAIGLGTSTTALYNMTNVQQLDYYLKYIRGATGKIKTIYDIYLWNFWQLALGKPDEYKIGGSMVASQNSSLDLNHDGQITVGEFKASIDRRLKSFPVAFAYIKEEVKKKEQ
jgi:hypothetical protein